MVLQDLIGNLTQRQEEKLTKAAGDYNSLVLSIVEGRDTDAETAGRVLDQAGKTPDDLQSDVSALEKRRRLAETIVAYDEARQARRAADEAIKAEEAAFAKLVDKHRQKMADLAQQYRLAGKRVEVIERARGEFARLVPKTPGELEAERQQQELWRQKESWANMVNHKEKRRQQEEIQAEERALRRRMDELRQAAVDAELQQILAIHQKPKARKAASR